MELQEAKIGMFVEAIKTNDMATVQIANMLHTMYVLKSRRNLKILILTYLSLILAHHVYIYLPIN